MPRGESVPVPVNDLRRAALGLQASARSDAVVYYYSSGTSLKETVAADDLGIPMRFWSLLSLCRVSKPRCSPAASAALYCIAALVLGPLTACSAKEPEPPLPVENNLTGSIVIEAGKVLKPVARGLYGMHAAWVWDAEGLWDPDRSQFRPEPLKLAIELRPGPIRFPGGIGADFYHWRDGIGPPSSRPIRSHGSDKDKSRNGFGTHELIELARRTGAEPLLTVNIVTGTVEEAAEWVAYCNRSDHPERARNGSKDPFNVRLWEIGNEPYIQAWSKAQKKGQLKPDKYVETYLEYAAAMRKADPSIKLIAVGGTNFGRYKFLVDEKWNEKVLPRIAPHVDYFAVHNAYTPVLIRKEPFYEVYKAMMAFPEEIRQNLELLNRQIETLAPGDAGRIKLAVTEWGPFFAPRKDEHFLDHSKTLGAALSVAATMQVFLHAERLEIANFFKFIDLAFQGMVGHDGVPKPSYYAVKMFTRHFGDLLLASTTDGPTYNLDKAVGGVVAAKNLPHLTAVGSLSQDRSKLYILAVNRHFTSPIRTKIQLNGFQPAARGTLRTLTAPSLDANNGPDLPDIGGIKWPKPAKAPHNSMFDAGKPGTVTIQTSTIDNAAGSFELVIPSKAVVALELDAAAGISALRAPGRKR